MFGSDVDKAARQKIMAEIIRAVRLHRGLGVSEMASAMGMPLRSYQHFEAGRGGLNLDLWLHFAATTKGDPAALFAAIYLRQPQLAVRCLDNNLISAMFMNVDSFNLKVGDAIKTLRANAIQKALGKAFDELTLEAIQPDPTADWIAERLRRDSADEGPHQDLGPQDGPAPQGSSPARRGDPQRDGPD